MKSHISNISITNFLGESDLKWDLKQINVLVGRNGSGKSTLLKVIQSTLEKNLVNESWLCNTCKIELEDGYEISSGFLSILHPLLKNEVVKNKENISSMIKKSFKKYSDLEIGKSNEILEQFFRLMEVNEDEIYIGPLSIQKNRDKARLFQERNKTASDKKSHQSPGKALVEEESRINVEFFSTINMSANSINKISLSDGKTSTILDMEIHDQIIVMKNHPQFLKLKESLVNILGDFFESTNKVIKFDKDLTVTKSQGEMIGLENLSSGERQILYIFLKVINASVKESLLLMDEPEISLHMAWQEMLIDKILEVNPNQQLIIVTHSPAIVMNGWLDSYTDINEILVPYEL